MQQNDASRPFATKLCGCWGRVSLRPQTRSASRVLTVETLSTVELSTRHLFNLQKNLFWPWKYWIFRKIFHRNELQILFQGLLCLQFRQKENSLGWFILVRPSQFSLFSKKKSSLCFTTDIHLPVCRSRTQLNFGKVFTKIYLGQLLRLCHNAFTFLCYYLTELRFQFLLHLWRSHNHVQDKHWKDMSSYCYPGLHIPYLTGETLRHGRKDPKKQWNRNNNQATLCCNYGRVG